MQSASNTGRTPAKPRRSPKTAAATQQAQQNQSGLNASQSFSWQTCIDATGVTAGVQPVSRFSSTNARLAASNPNANMQSMSFNRTNASSTQPSVQLPGMMNPLWQKHSKTMLLRRLEDGTDLCNYVHRNCLQNKLDGFDHCIRHILYDKNSTFRQCSFVHPQSHKRCPNAARKTERKEAICPWHFKKFYLKRKQAQATLEEKSNKGSLTQNVFKELEHYCSNVGHDKKRLNAVWTKQEDNSVTASEFLRQKIIEKSSTNEDKESDDELNNPLVDSCFRSDLIDSDSESIDSDQDEALKNAGVYTAEEVSMILRDKMLRLQSLYMSEFKYLRHLLKEKYKKFLFSLKNEREIYRIESQPFALCKPKTEDRMRLKAMMNYHRHHGVEALLKHQVQEKRKKATVKEGQTPESSSSSAQCVFTKSGIHCENITLPLSNYCREHILYDAQQVLFRPCAIGIPPCLVPAISFQKGNTCLVHQEQKNNPSLSKIVEENKLKEQVTATEADMFQAIDEINSVGLDSAPGSLFELAQIPELDSSRSCTLQLNTIKAASRT